jgi:hypothetical protein
MGSGFCQGQDRFQMMSCRRCDHGDLGAEANGRVESRQHLIRRSGWVGANTSPSWKESEPTLR